MKQHTASQYAILKADAGDCRGKDGGFVFGHCNVEFKFIEQVSNIRTGSCVGHVFSWNWTRSLFGQKCRE